MDVPVDMIDPRHRNEMMMVAVGRAPLGELDFVGRLRRETLHDGRGAAGIAADFGVPF